MRLSNLGNPLRTAKQGGVVVDGKYLPKGMDTGVATYDLQHSKHYI
jgi:hypothetical protein